MSRRRRTALTPRQWAAATGSLFAPAEPADAARLDAAAARCRRLAETVAAGGGTALETADALEVFDRLASLERTVRFARSLGIPLGDAEPAIAAAEALLLAAGRPAAAP